MIQTFSVPEIHCASCVFLLESLEEDSRGVRDVKVDLVKREAKIDYNENKINPEEIINQIEKVSGYKAVLNV